jgi:hypothetical protein
VLPHCGHLLSCGACQRFAALRERKRIFEVFRFGTPMSSALPKQEKAKIQTVKRFQGSGFRAACFLKPETWELNSYN